jgi:hypothetical protein
MDAVVPAQLHFCKHLGCQAACFLVNGMERACVGHRMMWLMGQTDHKENSTAAQNGAAYSCMQSWLSSSPQNHSWSLLIFHVACLNAGQGSCVESHLGNALAVLQGEWV